MSKQRVAGVLLLIGFGLIIVSSFIGPPGLYQEPDLDVRLQIISAHPGNWLGTNAVFALAILTTALGLFIFSNSLGEINIGSPVLLAKTAIILGSLSLVIHIGMRQFMPAENVERITLFSMGGFWLTLVAYINFGFIFLRAQFPKWLGMLFVGIPTVLAVLALIFGYSFYYNFPPQTFYLLSFVAGFVFLRRG